MSLWSARTGCVPLTRDWLINADHTSGIPVDRLHCCYSVYTPSVLALNIRNAEANRLAAEVASLAGETKTDAVILALKERLQRLQRQGQTTAKTPASLVNQLDKIALRCAGRPIGDRRSAEMILGYDAMGLPS